MICFSDFGHYILWLILHTREVRPIRTTTRSIAAVLHPAWVVNLCWDDQGSRCLLGRI